jgi:anti-sigma factor RsiW
MTIDPCKNETLLSALADDELSPEEAEAVKLHMETCPLCRQRFEVIHRNDAIIRDMTALEPSVDFERTFLLKVADLETRGKRISWVNSLFTGWRPIMASGMMASAIAAFLIFTGQDRQLSQEDVLIAQNIELLQDYDLIDHLDILEQWDLIDNMKDSL